MQQDGNVIDDKDERYARTSEFLGVVRSEWTSEKPFSYEGKYYQVQGGFSQVKPFHAEGIPIFVGGGSDAAIEVAREDGLHRVGVGLDAGGALVQGRDALIEGVYRNEVEKLAAAASRFAEKMSPLEALRAWMLLLVDYIAAKHIIAPAPPTGGGRWRSDGARR